MTFARRIYEPPPSPPVRPATRRATYAGQAPVAAVEKERAMQHSGYMNLVRAMACMHCGKPPRSDFAHADQGKGQGIKTDCRRGFPLCRACHHLIGSSGTFDRETKRHMEAGYARHTREALLLGGLWPKNLPPWKGLTP